MIKKILIGGFLIFVYVLFLACLIQSVLITQDNQETLNDLAAKVDILSKRVDKNSKSTKIRRSWIHSVEQWYGPDRM